MTYKPFIASIESLGNEVYPYQNSPALDKKQGSYNRQSNTSLIIHELWYMP